MANENCVFVRCSDYFPKFRNPSFNLRFLGFRHFRHNNFKSFFLQFGFQPFIQWLVRSATPTVNYKNSFLTHLIRLSQNLNPSLTVFELTLTSGSKTMVVALGCQSFLLGRVSLANDS